jgi:intracellular multiplication protein IcmK
MYVKLRASVAAAALLGSLFSTPGFAQEQQNLLLPPATYPAQQQQAAGQPGQPGLGLPVAQQPSKEEMEKKAFDQALKVLNPMTPDQERTVRQENDKIDKARGEQLAPVQPVSRSQRVSLKSGEAPALIRTSPGWISTITFSDVTGQPWPVLTVTNGNPTAFNVQSSGPAGSTNVITISSLQPYVSSNIAIMLVGAKVPVMMTLAPNNGGPVDFRVDAQMDQRGPNASLDEIYSDTLPPTSDSTMLGFLDGVPPGDAVKLKTSNGEVQAWRYNDMLYIRSDKSLLSPAYVSKQSNASRVNLYVLNEAPVLVMSNSDRNAGGGRLESVTIKR